MADRIENYEKFKLTELRARADRLGIAYDEDATRRQLAELINAAVDAGVEEAEPPFTPVTFYLAGPAPLCPQHKLYLGPRQVMVKFVGGRYEAQTPEVADAIRRGLGGMVYEADAHLTEDLTCAVCKWHTRSIAAFAAHFDLHPDLRMMG